MDYIPALILGITAGLHLLVGGFVYRRNPKGVVHRVLLLTSACFGVWALLCAVAFTPSMGYDVVLFARLAHAGSLFISTAFVMLGLYFPDGRTAVPRVARYGLWAVGSAIAAAVVFTPHLLADVQVRNMSVVATYGPLRFLYFAFVLFCASWGIVDLTARYRRSSGVRRVQIQYLLAGLALTAGLNAPTNILAPLLGMHSGAWLGPVFTLAFVGMVAHAIVRHRLMGIRLFVGRTVAYGIALAGVGLAFVVLFSVPNLLWGDSHPSPAFIGGVALGIAVLFQPLFSRVHAAVLRYLYRPPYDYQATVRDSSRALAAMMDLSRVLSFLLEAVVATLQVERGLALLRDPATRGFTVRAARSGWSEEQPDPSPGGAVLPDASPLVARLEATREAVVREELAVLLGPRYDPKLGEEMAFFGAEVAVPLLSGGSLLGVLFVGRKLSGEAFSSQDLDLLNTLGSEAATAIANARLHQEAMQTERLAALGGLAAGIAHEVKNPLVAVRTFAELLPDNYLDPEFHGNFAAVVLSEVDRIDRLIGQMLNYARPTPPKVERVDLNAVIEETMQLLGYEISRHSVALERRCAAGLPPLMADAAQLRQVVLNITLNALQVMPAGGSLRVVTRKVEAHLEPAGVPFLLPPEDAVEMEIANSGSAIDPELRERIFEPFFSQRSGGTGLGLSICKRIVTEHQGQIRVATTADGLTAFVVRLPVATPPPAEDLPRALPLSSPLASVAAARE